MQLYKPCSVGDISESLLNIFGGSEDANKMGKLYLKRGCVVGTLNLHFPDD